MLLERYEIEWFLRLFCRKHIFMLWYFNFYVIVSLRFSILEWHIVQQYFVLPLSRPISSRFLQIFYKFAFPFIQGVQPRFQLPLPPQLFICDPPSSHLSHLLIEPLFEILGSPLSTLKFWTSSSMIYFLLVSIKLPHSVVEHLVEPTTSYVSSHIFFWTER